MGVPRDDWTERDTMGVPRDDARIGKLEYTGLAGADQGTQAVQNNREES